MQCLMMMLLIILLAVSKSVFATPPSIYCPSEVSANQSCPALNPEIPRRVHVVSFHAVFGSHKNYYHWFYGRLTPFLHWLKRGIHNNGDIVLFIEREPRASDKSFRFVLDGLLPRMSCVIPILASAGAEVDVQGTIARYTNIDASQLMNLDVFEYKLERGVDLALYMCSSLTPATHARLSSELKDAYNFLRGSCGCCSSSVPFRRPSTTQKPLITIVDRGVQNKRRSIPNIDELYTALRNGLGSRAEVQRIEFSKLSTCSQWCTVHASTVLIGQHGAGLTNALFLEEGSLLLEIMPTDISFKGMYQCAAKLRRNLYYRAQQNGTHGTVNPQEILLVVKQYLTMPKKRRIHYLEKSKFPKFGPSKHMMSLKCPSKIGEFSNSWEHGAPDVTSLLVRTNECKRLHTVQSPSKLCFRDGNKNRTLAKKKCSFAIATMASPIMQKSLDLFIRTLTRFEPSRTLYVACDSATEKWLYKLETHLDIKPLVRLDKYRGKDLSAGTKLAKHYYSEKIYAMKFALNQGHDGCLYVHRDFVFLRSLPMMGFQSLGLYRDYFDSGALRSAILFARNITILDSWQEAIARSSDRGALTTVASDFEHFTIAENTSFSSFQIPETSRAFWFHISKLGKGIGRKFGLMRSSSNKSSNGRELVWGRGSAAVRVTTIRIDSIRVRATYLTRQRRKSMKTNYEQVLLLLMKTPIRDDICAVHECSS